MKLSRRGEYALRALIGIGLAHEAGRGVVSIADLAEKEVIPVAFLEQILFQLRQAGIVDARRGKLGGFLLARPAETITIGSIVRVIT